MRRLLFSSFLLLVAGLAAGAGLLSLGLHRFQSPGPSAASTTVIVPHGSGVSRIAEQLRLAGVIADPLVFKLGVRLLADRPLRAGEYEFPPRASPREVMTMMIEGKTVVHRLTIAEGLTTAEILALVRRAEALEGETPPAPPPEGSLLPETYHYSRGDSRPALIERMAEGMRHALAELWDRRADGLPLKTPEEAVTLASIVEKETGVAAERPRVAAVFMNRLRQGMPLQADPTVIYAITNGRSSLDRPLTRADLKLDSPYNTYLHPGLPPGPIANPGRASLEAVLNPTDTNDLYFVANGTGGHTFSATLSQHERNVTQWRKLEAGDDATPVAQDAPADASDQNGPDADPSPDTAALEPLRPAEAVGPPRPKPARAPTASD